MFSFTPNLAISVSLTSIFAKTPPAKKSASLVIYKPEFPLLDEVIEGLILVPVPEHEEKNGINGRENEGMR